MVAADVHACYLGHRLAAGDPPSGLRPSDAASAYCALIESNAWGASKIRADFVEALSLDPAPH
jgi:hypothetical protein